MGRNSKIYYGKYTKNSTGYTTNPEKTVLLIGGIDIPRNMR